MKRKLKHESELLQLKNVGRRVLEDLKMLGIKKNEHLKHETAQELYNKLQRITGAKQNICMLDLFSAIIHEAKTKEKLPWWYFSSIRKSVSKSADQSTRINKSMHKK
jgi:hypothetical protein